MSLATNLIFYLRPPATVMCSGLSC